MSYKAAGKSFRMIRPTLPKFGRVGPWSTGVLAKAKADAITVWLKEAAVTQPAVVQGILDGKFTLRDAVAAKNAGVLDVLLLDATDPPLGEAAEAFAKITSDSRVREGLGRLEEFATVARLELGQKGAARVRVTWLLDHSNVAALYRAAEASGMAPNSVRRSIHRAVADLLANRYGKAKRNAVMADVTKPAAADTRKVLVSADEMRWLLLECQPERFRIMVSLAVLGGIDRAPLLLLEPRLFDEHEGALQVLDTKTDARPRTIILPQIGVDLMRAACAGLAADERVFPYTAGQVRHMWERARDKAAGRPSRNQRERGAVDCAKRDEPAGIVSLASLRFKDLRHLLPTAWNALNLPAEDLPEIMGWAPGSKMSSRYTTARLVGERGNMDRVAEFLGLAGSALRAVA